MIAAGELSYISSYQMLSGDNSWKGNQASTKLDKKLGAYLSVPLGVKALNRNTPIGAYKPLLLTSFVLA